MSHHYRPTGPRLAPRAFEKQLEKVLQFMKEKDEDTKAVARVQEFLQGYPGIFMMCDRSGATPIHCGLTHGVAAGKVVAMLDAAGPRLATLSVKGRLPIHVALESNPKFEIIDKLIEQFPPCVQIRDSDTRLPLHMVLERQPFPMSFLSIGERLIEMYPDAAKEKSHDRLPLHICLEHGLPPRFTMKVLALHRCAAGVPKKDGKLPLHIAIENNLDLRVVEDLLAAHAQALIIRMPKAGTDLLVIEYALRNGLADPLIMSILKPRANPKALAYARAAALGRITKETPIETVRRQPRPKAKSTQQRNTGLSSKSLSLSEQGFEGTEQLSRLSQGCAGSESQVDMITLCIKPFAGDQIILEIDRNAEVEDLRKKIYDLEGTPPEEQRLTISGDQLKDGECLSLYVVQKESIVMLKSRFEILQTAIRNSTSEKVILMLLRLRPESAEEDDQYGMLPLHLAIQSCASAHVIGELLKHYKEAAKKESSTGTNGDYPLHLAIKNGYESPTIKLLLQDTRESDWTREGIYDPLHKYASKGSPVRRSPIHLTMESGTDSVNAREILQLLLWSKCPLIFRDKVTGYSALDHALASPHASELFRLVLDTSRTWKKSSVAEQGPHGMSPLHIGIQHHACSTVLEELCDLAPEVLQLRDNNGYLPIHVAAMRGASFSVMRLLLRFAPHTAVAKDGYGRTPVILAIACRAPSGVITEIARVAPQAFSILSPCCRTPLEFAVHCNSPPWSIEELVAADPSEARKVNLLDQRWAGNKAAATDAVRIVQEQLLESSMNVNANSQQQGESANSKDSSWFCFFGKVS